jgi:hypothetical protein
VRHLIDFERSDRFCCFFSYKVGKDRYSSLRDMDTIRRSHVDGTPKFSSRTFVVHFKLPDVLNTTSVVYSKVVQVSYCLQVLVLESKLKFPITISLVPLTLNEFQNPTPVPSFDISTASAPTLTMPLPYQSVTEVVESRKFWFSFSRHCVIFNLLFQLPRHSTKLQKCRISKDFDREPSRVKEPT